MMEVQKWQPHLHCCAMEMPVAPTPTTQVPCNLYMLLFGKLFLLLPTNPPELPSPGYPWSWIHKHLQEIDSGTVTKSQSVHCVIDNNLHSILHTHCVTKAQWKLWKLHLVVLCKDFASHSAHTFVFRKHNQNIKKHLIYAVDRESSELLYLEDLEVEVTVRPPA